MVPVLYIISAENSKTAISHAKHALASGCKWIQLQVNKLSGSKAEKTAKEIKKMCREQDATFIIENAIDLVKAIEADGIHLTNGMTTAEARQTLGEGFLIGLNVCNAEEVVSNKKQSADYICCGPFIDSTSSMESGLTLQDYESIVSEVEERGITLPLTAFGNIHPEHVDSILKTGIRGIMIQSNEENPNEQSIKSELGQFLNA